MSSIPEVLGDRYEVGEVLGRGGMAEVHRATDTRLGRDVAVKMLRADLSRDPGFQARFRREAQSSAALNHPAIVAVYDTGEDRVPDGVMPYIVMELVTGSTLRDLVMSGRRLLPERALEIISGVLSALEHAHRHGIVHRDIKPANVMLTPRGEVKVMDFGIARSVAQATQAMTQTSAVMGTAQYLSPEQAVGDAVDARTDLYSTGCLLFELLTGRPPFVGDSPVGVAYQHVNERPPLPSSLDPQIPSDIDAVVLKSLAKNPADRYQSAAQMRADVDRARAGRPVQAELPSAAETTTVMTRVRTVPVVESPFPVQTMEPPAPRRHTGAYFLLFLAVLAVIFAGGFGIRKLLDTPQQVKVPETAGQSVDVARQRILAAKLTVGAPKNQASETVAKDVVIGTEPAEGTSVDQKTPVAIVISAGPTPVTVPSVVGSPREEARKQLADDDHLNVVLVPEDSDRPLDEVTSTVPPAGESVPPGSTIELHFSNGKVVVPDVSNQTAPQALSTLKNANLGISSAAGKPATSPEQVGLIYDQFPAPGERRPPGTKVVVHYYAPMAVVQPLPSDPNAPPPDPNATPPG